MALKDWEQEKPKKYQEGNTFIWINKKNKDVIGIWSGGGQWYLDTPLQKDIEYSGKINALKSAKAYMRSH